MRGPKFIDQDVVRQVCNQERYQQHKYKLMNIQSDPHLSRKQVLNDNDKYQQIRANKFYTKLQVDLMKEQKLFRENAKILNRIVDIGNSRQYSSVQKRSVTRQSSASSIRSLNLPLRRQEAMKIIDQNHKLQKRLERTPSTFKNKEAYIRDYKKTQELKNRISKMSQQNRQRMSKLMSNISHSSQKLQAKTAKDFKTTLPRSNFTTQQRLNQTAKQSNNEKSYQTSSLSKLRIEPQRKEFQFPRIK